MIMFFVTLAIIIAITVAPVMFAARLVGAKNTGFGAAFLAVVLLGLLSAVIDKFFAGQSQTMTFAASSILGAAILSAVIGTTFFRGLAISVIATIVQIIVIVAIAMVSPEKWGT